MKTREPTENRLPSGAIAPNRSNNAAVQVGEAISIAIAMPPATIVPMSLGIRLFMEYLPNDLRERRGPAAADPSCKRAERLVPVRSTQGLNDLIQ